MLEIKNLTFGFPHRRLMTDFSLVVRPGELVHLVGPNGAGKSTLVALIAGLMPLDQGSIIYTHKSPDPVEDRRSYVEYLPAEANALYTKMNARQNLIFWSELRRQTHNLDEINQVLSSWGLGHSILAGNFPVDKYSTGMKRRLALARLMLAKVPCWLLDEPVYGLDGSAIAIFRSMLKKHIDNNGLAIMVSHDLAALEGIEHRRINLGGDH